VRPELKTRWLGRVSFEKGLELQESLVSDKGKGGFHDELLLLEHDPVYTMGRARDESSLGKENLLPYPIYRTNRGGQATYHGPGQLVGYPILDLNRRGRDLHRYLRFLEEVIISILAEYSVQGIRRGGLTGVWIEDRKIASIGIGVRRWISMHGFALNVAAEHPGFDAITPCGISNVTMTSLSAECGNDLETHAVAEIAGRVFLRELEKLPGGLF